MKLKIAKKTRRTEHRKSIGGMPSLMDRTGMPCARKKMYDTKKDAKIVCAQLSSLPKEGSAKPDAKNRIYECRHCGGWHLTSLPLEKHYTPKPTKQEKP